MLVKLIWDGRLFLKGDTYAGGSTYSVLQIINGLAQVPFECVFGDAYKGIEENTIRNLDRLVTQLASMDNRFPLKLLVHGTDMLSLKLRHWLLFRSNFL